MDAQCISNTTRVCLKALEKHFFLLIIKNFKKIKKLDHDEDNEPWWATYHGSEAAQIARYFTTNPSATSSDDNGPETVPTKWYDHALHEFQQAIDFYEVQQ